MFSEADTSSLRRGRGGRGRGLGVPPTTEQVASNDARQTAADLAVTELQRRWRAETPTASNIEEINRFYSARCRQLGIIFADIELRVEPPKGGTLDPNGGWATEPSCTLA